MADQDTEFFDAVAGADRIAVMQAIDLVRFAFNGGNAIERAVEWFNDNMAPQDVFDRERLDEWARVAGYVKPT